MTHDPQTTLAPRASYLEDYWHRVRVAQVLSRDLLYLRSPERPVWVIHSQNACDSVLPTAGHDVWTLDTYVYDHAEKIAQREDVAPREGSLGAAVQRALYHMWDGVAYGFVYSPSVAWTPRLQLVQERQARQQRGVTIDFVGLHRTTEHDIHWMHTSVHPPQGLMA